MFPTWRTTEEGTLNSQLLVTLDGVRDNGAGLALQELQSMDEVLDKVSSTLAMFVRHSSGHRVEPGQSESWVYSPRLLELRRSAPGCLSAQWTLGPSPDARTDIDSNDNQAIQKLLKSPDVEDLASDVSAQDYFSEISDALPNGVVLWLGDADNPAKIAITHTDDAANDMEPRDETLVSDLHAIGLRCAALLRPGPSAADHGDLLYDERGLPK